MSESTIYILQRFFTDCAKNQLTIDSMVVGDNFWDRLALEMGIKHKGFYENEFTFNSIFGSVKIIRETKR